jgi:DNA-directed RNA polymerase subunit N (RpoN/RPB10)
MIIPIRCVTCGKVIADKWKAYLRMTGELSDPKSQKSKKSSDKTGSVSRALAMDELGLARYCCRRHFLGQADLIEKI